MDRSAPAKNIFAIRARWRYTCTVTSVIEFGSSVERRSSRALIGQRLFFFPVLRGPWHQFWRAVWGTRKGAPVPFPVFQPARSATLSGSRGGGLKSAERNLS